ncbi:response regulator transcription factor [Candidatus Regiella insecticola]|nr:LuxR family transcriptional regulator [Candidatus Regiella insecticola]
MKILIIDECYYTRCGVHAYLNNNPAVKLMETATIEQASFSIQDFDPDIVIVNLTQYCSYGGRCPLLEEFIHCCGNKKMYIYLNTAYPFSDTPVPLMNTVSILAKKRLPALLNRITRLNSAKMAYYNPSNFCLVPFFSPQEQSVIYYWITKMPNCCIAKKLNISDSTVYCYKRHITEKIKVRNRLELCFIYNILKYLY